MRFFGGKTALITGASSGLGADFARQLAAEGANLILVARRLERLRALQHEIQQQHLVDIVPMAVDLARPDAADALYDRTEAAGLVVDILINNAGFGIAGEFTDIDSERELEMLTLNILAPTRLCKLYGRDMIVRGQGHILLVASMTAFQPTPNLSTYAASKAYVQSFGEALAFEMRPYGVDVTVLAPSGAATEFAQVAGQELSPMHEQMLMPSAEVVAAALNGLQAGDPLVVPGLMNQLGALANHLIPRRLAPRLMDWLRRASSRD